MSMRYTAFALVLSILPVAAAQSAELYKVIDANGRVSYSQIPPAEKEEGAKVVSMKVAGDSASKVTKVGKYQYCGELQLPYERTSSYSARNELYYIETVTAKRKQWRKKLSRQQDQSAERSRKKLESRNAKYVSSYQRRANAQYHAGLQSDAEKMRDLRCAIQWADNRLSGDSDTLTEHDMERERLTEIRSKLQSRLTQSCGELPKFDPTDHKAKEGRARWYSCSKRYRTDLKQVERRLARHSQ